MRAHLTALSNSPIPLKATTALLLPILLFSSASAATLSTAAANNGSGGVFMTLTATANDLSVTAFSFPLGGEEGSGASIEMWVRTGSYSGFTDSSEGWTLFDTLSTSVGATSETWVSATLNTPLSLLEGQATSVYLHSITEDNRIRYTGQFDEPPVTSFNDAELTLTSDVGISSSTIPFSGNFNTPRAFSGTVEYEVVPETSSLALAGVGALLLGRRRRRA